MKLYELTNDFQRLFDSLEDMTENAELTAEEKAEAEKVWFDTLECVEAEFTDKAEALRLLDEKLLKKAS